MHWYHGILLYFFQFIVFIALIIFSFQNYKEKETGKVVVYTTTMGILRDTYQACMKVKQILRTLLVKFEERDVFMSSEYQTEIQERMRCDQVLVPQVFVDGQHIGVSNNRKLLATEFYQLIVTREIREMCQGECKGFTV